MLRQADAVFVLPVTAGPAIASLTGDYFPGRERARMYSYILGGEVAGTAVGFIVSGSPRPGSDQSSDSTIGHGAL